jgi:hypothetical protein
MLRELKFYVRDLFRGPDAKTPFGFYGSSIGLAVLTFLALLEVGNLLHLHLR